MRSEQHILFAAYTVEQRRVDLQTMQCRLRPSYLCRVDAHIPYNRIVSTMGAVFSLHLASRARLTLAQKEIIIWDSHSS
jgi:hypothetical protein